MPSSTSSFNVKVSVFVGTLVIAFLALAAYCQFSPFFTRVEHNGIKRYSTLSGKNAAFGDSQIGESEKIPGFDFFGPGGLQSAEFNRLVHYIYATTTPEKIIVELAPQWFGRYHLHRGQIVTANALPPPYLKAVIFSPYFYRDLKSHLLAAMYSLRPIGAAEAGEYNEPTLEDIIPLSREWERMIKAEPGIFDWSKFPEEARKTLTLARAYEQNPVLDFRTNGMAAQLEEGIEFLLAKGADICFFEPPITDDLKRYRDLIDGTNYAAFETYAAELIARYDVRWVRHVADFEDSEFNNQDHLHPRGVTKLWPLVAEACFPES